MLCSCEIFKKVQFDRRDNSHTICLKGQDQRCCFFGKFDRLLLLCLLANKKSQQSKGHNSSENVSIILKFFEIYATASCSSYLQNTPDEIKPDAYVIKV